MVSDTTQKKQKATIIRTQQISFAITAIDWRDYGAVTAVHVLKEIAAFCRFLVIEYDFGAMRTLQQNFYYFTTRNCYLTALP
jgi:hypothetical protein